MGSEVQGKLLTAHLPARPPWPRRGIAWSRRRLCACPGGERGATATSFCRRQRTTNSSHRLASRLRRQACAVGGALAVSTIVVPDGQAQNIGPGPVPGITTLPGTNAAQQAMAQSINTFCPTVSKIADPPTASANVMDLATICSAMIGNALQLQGQPSGTLGSYGLSQSGLQAALQGLNGGAEVLAATNQASVAQTTQTSRQIDTIEKRLKELRNGSPVTVAANAAPPGAQLASLGSPASDRQILIAQDGPPQFAYSLGPVGVFVNGLGQFGSRDLTTSENGYSFNNAGFVAGADIRVTPQVIAGLAFGYTQSNTNFDTSSISAPGQSLSGNLMQGNLYATYFPTDALYLNGIAVIGGGNNDSRRHIVIPSANPTVTPAVDRIASGSFGSRIAGFTVAGGYNFPLAGFIVTPNLRFLYQHTGVDSFSEAGAMGADLQFGSSSVNTVATLLGADAQYPMSTSFGALYPIARFRWAHQYNPGNTSVSVAYSNDPTTGLISSFILPGTPTSKNYFDLGVGISLQLVGGQSVFLNYDSVIGISHVSYNSFTAGVRLMF